MDKVQISYLRKHGGELSVLYVEDDLSLAHNTTVYLKKFFGTVITCFDGSEAYEAFQNRRFDMIITDLAMPKVDGFALISLIKEHNPEQIILINSAYNDNCYLVEADKLKVDGYLIKPTKNDQFIETLYKVTEKIVNQRAMNQ